jgi:hypothetical protein
MPLTAPCIQKSVCSDRLDDSLRRWIMSIAPTLMKYLDQNAMYDTLFHEPTMTSMRTAEACHIPSD